MTSRDFCYWLQGFYELAALNGPVTFTPAQAAMVHRHLELVFKHEIDPSIDKGRKDVASVFQEIHDGAKPDASDVMKPFPGLFRC